MTVRILVMGLPGSGKTTLSQAIVDKLLLSHTVNWFNADIIRKQYNDWDFSREGRRRQAKRMSALSSNSQANFVVCDFVCPTEELRKIFNPDVTIWVDTIAKSQYIDTNSIFERPTIVDYHVTDWSDTWYKDITKDLINWGKD